MKSAPYTKLLMDTVKLPGENFQASSHAGQSPRSDGSSVKSVVLNSAEELYADLRDKNFSAVGTALSRKAKAISAHLDNAIVAFGGVKVSAFARDSGEIFLDSFDDSVIMINPDIPDERELREWLKDNQ
ncbi:LOW QUALITY PROTEIN: hypothetical protein DAPPUDRAFT_252891 [Daphnia pulex]|uniref:Uncharacterized protein n=1 Tax=Daphnia pulex TaxID=6669 RepID=E9H3Q3_DAPPU|nr:LOW QUALITY PROTEIN: hypothetical protein DAPPUDRAFT_252891 [Daphnia pulex]|eukprot:EFX73552.1 LOW QUALITY PROTEIN: hypothetical protein DAPPUDRAFT_252891 [Daphnia pulex]